MSAASEQLPVDILIVDDKIANIVSLEAILGGCGYNLVSATSGEAALRQVLNREFAVILLDVMMPDMDGFEFAQIFRQRARDTPTPIIFLTAIATDLRYLIKGYAAGAVDYLQKPLDAEVVRAKVAVFVELHRRNLKIRRQEEELREIQRFEQERRLTESQRESERHYLELAEAIPQIVWSADGAGNIRYFNRKWKAFTGFEAEASGEWAHQRRAVHEDDIQTYRRDFDAGVASGEEFEIEVRLRKAATGQFFWHLCRATPEKRPDGEVIGWHGTYTDIHAQKRASRDQAFLADVNLGFNSESSYRDALLHLAQKAANGFTDGCLIDLDVPGKPFLRIVAVSGVSDETRAALAVATGRAEALALLGLAFRHGRPECEILAANWSEDLPPQLVPPALRSSLSHAGISSVASAPIELRSGRAGAVTFFGVGTRGRLDERDLALAVETSRHVAIAIDNVLIHAAAAEASKRKDEFLAMLSHELRTPLNAVIGWTELLRMGASEDDLEKGLEAVERNAKSLAQLVGDLLDVSRFITGKLEIVRRPVDLNLFLEGIVTAVRPLADAKELHLSLQLAPRAMWVSADLERLQQVFSNLLMNAIKFTPPGGKIHLSSQQQDAKVAIRIRDSGVGIAPEMQPHIFERFRQADSSRTRQHGGLGLGLSIVRNLLELHDGSVGVVSGGLGKGSEFYVLLPVLANAGTGKGLASVPVRQEVLKSTVLNGASVLLVDDDASSRALVETFLRSGGARVTSAASVREALERLDAAQPDVVLTDIGMPEEDGFALLHRLKELEAQTGRRFRTAALTAYASEEDSRRAFDAGFELYLTKPVRGGELIKAIGDLMGRSETPAAALTAKALFQ